MRSILTATPTSGLSHAGLATAARVIRALMHVEVALHLIVQIVVARPTGRPSVGTTLLHVDLGRLVIADGDFQVIATVLATAPARAIVRAATQCIGS